MRFSEKLPGSATVLVLLCGTRARAALFLLLLASLHARASTILWTNTAGGNWSVAANWSPNQVPGTTDDAKLTTVGFYSVTLDTSAAVNSLVVGGAGGLQTFSVPGSAFTVSSNATFNTFGNLNFSGGAINGAGSMSLAGSNVWAGGSWTISGATTIQSGGTLSIIGVNDHDMPGGTLNNNGVIIRTGGRVRGGSGSLINNSGLWLEQTDQVLNNDYGGAAPIFANTGTFRKTAGVGISSFAGFQFNNANLVDVQSGTLVLGGGGGGAGSFNTASNSICNFTASYTFGNGTVFTGSGLIGLEGGSFQMTGLVVAPSLEMDGGNLFGSNAVIQGVFTWAGGNFNNGGSLTIASNSTLNITSGNDHDMLNCVLTNYGKVDWSGGRVRGGGVARIYNLGLWDARLDNVLNDDYGSGTVIFDNLGTFRKSAGTNTTACLAGVVFNNNGLVEAQTGTLAFDGGGAGGGQFNAAPGATIDFDGGAQDFNGGSLLIGGGNFGFESGSFSLNGTITSTNLEVDGGSIAASNVVINGVFNWNGGNWNGGGSITVASNSTLNIISGNDHDLPGVTLNNQGTITHTGGRIRGGGGAVINNNGLWLEETDAPFNNDYGGAAMTFVNAGTFRKTAGSGATTFLGGVALNNGGVMDVQNGTVVVAGGGSGSGVFNAVSNAACNFASDCSFAAGCAFTGTGANLLTSGIVTFNGAITSVNLNWVSARIAGTLTIPSGNTLYIMSGSDHDFPGAVINNNGIILHTGGRVRGGSASVINNTGLWLDETDAALNNDYGGPASTFVNAGIFRKTAGLGATTFLGGFLLSNSNLVDVQSGTVAVNGGGANSGTFNSASNSACAFNSDYTFDAGSAFVGAGASLLNAGLMTFDGTVVSTNLGWVSARVAGTLNISNGSTLYIVSGSDHDLPGASLINNGTVIHSGGRIRGGGATLIDNEGLWLEQTDTAFNNDYGGAASTFLNNGSFVKTASLGATTFQGGVLFTNTSTLDVESGPVAFNGGYGQLGETLRFGLASATNSGQINISGGVNLGGTLALDILNGYVPATGDAFTLVTYGANLGAFTNLSLSALGPNQGWLLSYNPGSVLLQVVAQPVSTTQITGSITDSLGHPITNATVFAYTTNSPTLYLSSGTDANGRYSIGATNGLWVVGVQGLPALGFKSVTNQVVMVNNGNQTANFVAQPFSGQSFTVAAAINPAGAGSVVGGGSYPYQSTVTVTATPNTSIQPFLFSNWTENGFFQSPTANYTFVLTRDRQLVANFTLPLFSISASNNPPGGGTVSGAGSFFYGVTNSLTANPNPGYNFANWTVDGAIVGANSALNIIVQSNTLAVANYSDANVIHFTTTATLPAGLAGVSGGGTYTNGQTANFVAPAVLTNGAYIYTFQQFVVSNTVASVSPNFSKTFSTLDPTNLQYVAVYRGATILPLLSAVTANFASPVPATTNFLLALQFDRTMQTNASPNIVLTNSATGAAQPTIATNGSWGTTAVANDTYFTPPIAFLPGMNGTNQLFVSGARDLNGNSLATINPANFIVQATPPPAPVLSITSFNSSSAVVSWAGYAPSNAIAGFRVYLAGTNFNSIFGVPILTELGPNALNFQVGNLSLDTPYYVEVQAVDVAGNTSPGAAPLLVFLPSTIPPLVRLQEAPVGASSAELSWTSYNTANLLGFTGFRLYYAQTNFNTVTGLTPQSTLAAGTTTFQVNGLDRTKSYYFAVVGFNDTNGFNPVVLTARWSDPYAGNIGLNTTIGGTGQTIVSINQSIVVVSNATLTIQPGTTLLFAPGTSLTVQQGALVANGTALAPVILDSANHASGHFPSPGDWGGVVLGPGAGSSSLAFVEVLYGSGLTLNGCAPMVQAFTASYNLGAGLTLQNGATLTTRDTLLNGNGIGIQQADTASLAISNSVILNNGTNGLSLGNSTIAATLNWWGTPMQADILAQLQGGITATPFLNFEPLLTPALGASNAVTQVGSPFVNLVLACRTADGMRISEDFSFNGVFFSPFTNHTTFPLSAGGGLKHIFAQYRSITGQTNTPIELDINLITAGPMISSFSLTEGETLNRPLTVTGAATAALGMADMEFYVDGVLTGTNAGGSLNQFFDIRSLGNAIHLVELLARDSAGNLATLQESVVIAKNPPLAPNITTPAADILTNTAFLTISGTAEPGITVQITRNGQIVGVTNADAGGRFSLANAVLVEGVNTLVAVASDNTGTTPSASRLVTVETIPPAQLVLNPPVYTPGAGLNLTWQFPPTGKHATTFQLFWSTAVFTSTNQATGHSVVVNSESDTIQGLADGTYHFAVIGYDAVGNPSPLSALVSTVYSATPPSLTIAYGQPSPVGPGTLTIVLTANKALAATPTLTLQPSGSVSPVLLSLANVALNTYQTTFTITQGTPSGTVFASVSAQDQFGNVFLGAPNGPVLIIDTVPPSGAITTAPAPPVQNVANTNVAVSLVLSKLTATGTIPALTFTPPVGANVVIPLTGVGSNWNGSLPLTPAMGSGFGRFSLTVQDGLGNTGTNIASGGRLEIYNTALPSPPPAPTGLSATSLPGGLVRLSWNVVTNAQIYRLYRGSGTNFPGALDLDNITSNLVVELPPADGFYSFGISASRFGSESGISNTVTAVLSQRTPPNAPTNVLAALALSGVQITWQQPFGSVAVDHYNIYRNGTLIQTVSSVVPVVDYPPAGINTYVVAAVDAVGNQNSSPGAILQLLVGPVSNLSALVTSGQPNLLSWVSTDTSAVGFNVYRNGIKQNASVLSGTNYTDNLTSVDVVQYGVTAVNGSGKESPPRLVSVFPVRLGLLVNSSGTGTNNPILTGYFDHFQIGITNLSGGQNFPLALLLFERAVPGLDSLSVTQRVAASVGAGLNLQQSLIVPEAPVASPQVVEVTAVQQTDSQGSSVTYEAMFDLTSVQPAGPGIAVSVNQLPLAGGLTPFQVQIFNRGYADMDIIVLRDNGNQPGDVYISVRNGSGQEVSRTPYQGAPPGTILLPDGRAYVRIRAGSALTFTIPNVLTPLALSGATNTTFVAVVANIYNQVGTGNELVAGSLSGSMISSLSQAPYFGTSQTDQSGYENDQPVVITGRAIDRLSGLPVPKAALNIGFSTRGFRWYQSVTTDTNGNYSYTYNPPPGFAGTLTIWAANPLVVDQLNQAQITIYRMYAKPSSGDIQMSKNDTQSFSIQLINPGDVPLTGFNATFRAYQLSGTNQVAVTKVTGTNLTPAGFNLPAGQSQTINLQLAATIDAPDSVQVEFTFGSAEGAAAKFTASVGLFPAVPVLAVTQPAVGYLEVSLNRGNQLSGQVTLMNSGLRDLQGITLLPPTNVNWMTVNLPVSTDGKIHLPDLAVGQSNSFTVVFTPPTNTALAFYQDSITVQGSNAASPFVVNVYALVTSSLTGGVQFEVDDILGAQVPGASIRLRNDLLQAEVGPFFTDTNGFFTVTNLQEGAWNWQVTAPGTSAQAGTVTVIAGQTVYQHARLNRSLVTINFSVVPVPFTDQYTITIEQTYETFVPLPVLVLTPASQNFNIAGPGFHTNVTVTAQNQGLIQMTDFTMTGSQDNQAAFTPLITYIPVLLPQQSVDIPCTVTYTGTNAPTQQGLGGALTGCIPNPADDAKELQSEILGLVDGLNALAHAEGRCIKDNSAVLLAGVATVLITLRSVEVVSGYFASISEQFANYIGCVIGTLIGEGLNGGAGGRSGGSGGGGPGGQGSGQDFDTLGDGCFAPDTTVLMADGTLKPIAEIQTNDVVRCGTGSGDRAVVQGVYNLFSTRVHEIQLLGADAKARPLRVTEEHLLWVDGSGWTAAGRIKPGDLLFDSEGRRVQVTANKLINGGMKVYTLKLLGENAFYADDILAHDLCGNFLPVGEARKTGVER